MIRRIKVSTFCSALACRRGRGRITLGRRYQNDFARLHQLEFLASEFFDGCRVRLKRLNFVDQCDIFGLYSGDIGFDGPECFDLSTDLKQSLVIENCEYKRGDCKERENADSDLVQDALHET